MPDYAKVLLKLRAGLRLDIEAKAFCAMMVEKPREPHAGENAFEIIRKDDYSFSIRAHRREVVALYRQQLDDTGPKGCYDFLLVPQWSEGSNTVPKVVLQFHFDRGGEFVLDGREYSCQVDDFFKSGVRIAVIDSVLEALQAAL